MTDRELGKQLKKAAALVKSSGTVAIFPHIHADGDAIGSAFGIAFVLRDMGKAVTVFMEEDPGDKLRFLLDGDIRYVITDGDSSKYTGVSYDLAIINDCSDLKRTGTRLSIIEKASKKIKIDHHVEIDKFGDEMLVDPSWSATCEGMFLLAEKLGYDFTKAAHGKKAATAFYTGLLTDSGQFGYSNTTPLTHRVASELMKATGDVSDIARNMFEIKTYSKVKIFAKAYEHAEIFADGKAVFTYVSQEDIDETGATHEDTDGISSSLCAVAGIEASVFAKPDQNVKGHWKLSMRSYRYCDVAEIAGRLGGGGHVRAAGCDFEGTFEEMKQKMIEEICCGIEKGRNTQHQ